MSKINIKKVLKREMISPLDRKNTNPLYTEYLQKQAEKGITSDDDDGYNFKGFICKKYFKANILLNLINILIGAVLLSLTVILMNHALINIVLSAVLIFISGGYFIGFGTIAVFFYLHMYLHYKDYIWSEEDKLAAKIRKFYC